MPCLEAADGLALRQVQPAALAAALWLAARIFWLMSWGVCPRQPLSRPLRLTLLLAVPPSVAGLFLLLLPGLEVQQAPAASGLTAEPAMQQHLICPVPVPCSPRTVPYAPCFVAELVLRLPLLLLSCCCLLSTHGDSRVHWCFSTGA